MKDPDAPSRERHDFHRALGQPGRRRAGAHAAEIAQLREALAAAGAELLELRERRSIEMARLERQAYWLERWGIDLDAWMRRRPRAARSSARVALLLRVLRRLARTALMTADRLGRRAGQGRRALPRRAARRGRGASASTPRSRCWSSTPARATARSRSRARAARA